MIVLLTGLFVNGCRISRLLSGATAASEIGPIVVNPAQIVDSALSGETTPHEAKIAITQGGAWFATTSSAWLRATPTSGNARATVRLSLDPRGLSPGLHQGSVKLQEHDSTGPSATVNVKFRIQQPVLKVTPGSLSYTAQSSNDVFHDSLVVSNAGDGPLVWSATTANHSSWLVLSDTAGRGPGKIVVEVSNAGLSYFGTFTETIIVTAPGAKSSPARIDVTLRRHRHGDATP